MGSKLAKRTPFAFSQIRSPLDKLTNEQRLNLTQNIYSGPMYEHSSENSKQHHPEGYQQIYYKFPDEYKPYNYSNYFEWGGFIACLVFSLLCNLKRLLQLRIDLSDVLGL